MATTSTSAATNTTKAPVALVTAGSAGLGAAGARLFAANGYRVIVNYNSNTARAEALLAELLTISGGATSTTADSLSSRSSSMHKLIKADMGDRSQIQALVAETVAFAGGIDVIFSNQGYTHIRGWDSLDDNVFEDDWDRCFNVNVKSHLWLLHAAKPYLDEVEGCMVVTSSLAGVRPGGSSLVCFVLFSFFFFFFFFSVLSLRLLLLPSCYMTDGEGQRGCKLIPTGPHKKPFKKRRHKKNNHKRERRRKKKNKKA